MSNRYFNVKKPSDIVTIADDTDPRFLKLSDGNMIRSDTFKSHYQPVLEGYEETTLQQPIFNDNNSSNVDVDSFFNSSTMPSNVVDGIKQSDSSKASDTVMRPEVVHKNSEIPQQNSNSNLITQVGEQAIPNNTNTDVSNYKVFENDEDAYKDFISKSEGNRPQQQAQAQQPLPLPSEIDRERERTEMLFEDEKLTYGEEEAITRRTKRLNKLAQPMGDTQQQPAPVAQPTLSPVEMMFSTFKRNHDISINVNFDDKIGSPEFIKLMMENMDGDIVAFYKKKVMDNIMDNLSIIETIVEKTIREEIFGVPEEIVVQITIEPNTLIPGGKTTGGKQKYKYIDDSGKTKEMLPTTAKKKGYKALKL